MESGRRAPEIKYVQLYTTHRRECSFKTAELADQHRHNKHTQHNFSTPTTMSRFKAMTMMLPQHNVQGKQPGGSRDIPQKRNGGTVPPQVVLETVVSSSQSQTSSIGIGEFGEMQLPSLWLSKTACSLSSSFYREQMHLWTSAWTQLPFVGTCVFAVVCLKLMPTSGGMTTESC